METLSIIAGVAGVILVLYAISLCSTLHEDFTFKGALIETGVIILCGVMFALSNIIHISDEDKTLLAEEVLRNDGHALIIQHALDPDHILYSAAADLNEKRKKLLDTHKELTEKAKLVSDFHSQILFNNKLASISQLIVKLENALYNLEQCAFEQVLLSSSEKLTGKTDDSINLSKNITEELNSIHRVMQEVEQISNAN